MNSTIENHRLVVRKPRYTARLTTEYRPGHQTRAGCDLPKSMSISGMSKTIGVLFSDKTNMAYNQSNHEDIKQFIKMKALHKARPTGAAQLSRVKPVKMKPSKKLSDVSKLISGGNKRTSDMSNKKQLPAELYFQIRQVCKNLEVLKQYGFSEKKLTKWMNSFLVKKTQVVQEIFLRSWINKKSLDNTILYQRVGNLELVFAKMEKLVNPLSEPELSNLVSEIKSFKNYIEEIVINKSQSNLDELLALRQIDPSIKFNKPSQYPKPEVMYFMKDLKILEDRYGELASVSRLNKQLFARLQQTEDKFVAKYYCFGDHPDTLQ